MVKDFARMPATNKYTCLTLLKGKRERKDAVYPTKQLKRLRRERILPKRKGTSIGAISIPLHFNADNFFYYQTFPILRQLYK